MKIIASIILMICLTFLSGCSVESKIKKIGAGNLISDSEAMIEKHPEFRVIPESLWPDSIKRLHPKEVRPFQRGVLIQKNYSKNHEAGVYIIIESPEIPAQSGSGDGFTKIHDRIYWADIKIRSAMKLQKPKIKTEPAG
jgi:hypothetical protein